MKQASISTYHLIRRINRALAHSHQSLWFSNDAGLGPYMIVVGDAVQATGIADLEALARKLGVMHEGEVWGERTTHH